MLIEELREKWWSRVLNAGLRDENVIVRAGPLSPVEAIGKPKKWIFPLMIGREVMIEAEIKGFKGQAYTDMPSNFSGNLYDVYNLSLNSNGERAILISTINATYRLLGLISNTRHCRDDGPEKCAMKIASKLYDIYGDVKIGLIGHQPAILHYLTLKFSRVRVTDMDPSNIGRSVNGVIIESHENNFDLIDWSDVVLVTGTTIVNNTIDEILNAGREKELYFYGVTIAAAAFEFKLNRLCFESK